MSLSPRRTRLQNLISEDRAGDVMAELRSAPEVREFRDWDEGTWLHRAAESGAREVAAALINDGFDVNATNWDNKTPLALAARTGDEALVRLLLESGADPNVVPNDGRTPLIECVLKGNLDLVRFLVERGAKVDQLFGNTGKKSAVMGARNLGYTEMADYLVSVGAPEDTPIGDLAQATPERELIDAIQVNDVERVKRLVEEHPQVIQSAKQNWLYYAAKFKSIDAATYLVKIGMDVDAPDFLGRPPLAALAGQGDVEGLKILLRLGADPDKPDERGLPPISGTCFDGHFEAAKLLVEQGARVDMIFGDYHKHTLVTEALRFGHDELADFFRKQGAPDEIPSELDSPKIELLEIRQHITAHLGPCKELSENEVIGPGHHLVRSGSNEEPSTVVTTMFSAGAAPENPDEEDGQFAEVVMHLPSHWPVDDERVLQPEFALPLVRLMEVGYWPDMTGEIFPDSVLTLDHTELLDSRGTLGAANELGLTDETDPFAWYAVIPHATLPVLHTSTGKRICFYTVLPLHDDECVFLKENGYEALLARLEAAGYGLIVDPKRKSVIA